MKKMKKKISILLVISILMVSLSGCFGGSSSSSKREISEKDYNDAGYYKKNGKWYYQGH